MNFRNLMAAKSQDRRRYTREQVEGFKRDVAAGMSAAEAGRKHGLPRWVVRDVIDRKSWRDVEPDDDGPQEAA